jgi:hypothetical protein
MNCETVVWRSVNVDFLNIYITRRRGEESADLAVFTGRKGPALFWKNRGISPVRRPQVTP